MKKIIPLAYAVYFTSLVLPGRFAAGASAGSAASTPFPTLEEEARAGLVSGREMTALVKRVKDEYERSDFKATIADCTRIIEFAPRNVWAYTLRGLAKKRSGNLAGALEDFDRAIALDPDGYPSSYLNRGDIRLRRGDVVGAQADLQRARKADPKYGPVYGLAGDLKMARADYSGAAAEYSRALALNPDDAHACFGRCQAWCRLGRYDSAMADANHLISLAPKYAPAYFLRGICKHHQGDLVGTVADYRRSLELNPKDTWTFRAIAYVEMQQRRYAEALEDAQRSLRDLTGPDADYAQFLVWILHVRLGRAQEADQLLSSHFAARKHTADGEWAGHIGAFLLGHESEQAFVAHAASGDAEKIGGQRCEAWYYTGIKKLLVGDKIAAADDFRKSLATGQNTFNEYQLAQSELKSL